MDWKNEYKSKLVAFEEASKAIKSKDRIWISPTCSAPVDLVNALCKRYKELENVELSSGLLMHSFEFLKPAYKGHLNYHTFFLGPVERKMFPYGNVDIVSINFSNIDWFMKNIVKANVLLAEVSEPDENGYMSYGPLGTFCNDTVVEDADMIIVQVNKNVPYIYGEKNLVHVSKVNYICEKDHPIPELPQPPVSEIDKKIASHILPLIPDGSTIQIGLGGIANAVGYGLEDKKDLGVHTEMLTDSMVYLAKKGVINCKNKSHNQGKIICGFGLGNKELYEFLDKNELIHCAPISKVNNPIEIAKNDNFISINSCLMVDLTGQVASEAVGFNQYSCTGGQLDFVQGAGLSKGGKSFITLASTAKTKKGIQSKIVLSLPLGTAVTTPRSQVQFVVTEYGVADLYNKSIPDRAKELISIAHPDYREELTEQAKKAGIIVG
ncbi:acetyl-CoA hydrolase/transferase family protein [Crassaminicella profunda]|uniref:acetyl-CoA hydrolase/transferase family protein n=1 Tax=Crassaminicella profunda TaxID=1286698 RepID=UPI001CA77456|nr:acetyl-CoA hydrolase/transferase C-terminal domain-containing protein [Crassaminicella profunda]QZY54006.1 hypothetical protein K7H06_13185 [Crassaminicella profunda]